MMLLDRLLGRPAAPPLASDAPKLVAPELVAPTLGTPTPAPPPGLAAVETAQGRRDRVPAEGDRVLADSLSAKVLHGWLQNRHQTLFPLVINVRSLAPEQASAVAGWLAVAALATRPQGQAGPGAGTGAGTGAEADGEGAAPRRWLASVGADPAVLALFDAALAAPLPLHQALAAMARQGLGAYAYVAALAVADPRDPATPPFLDYVAARLALPASVVRSAVRRHRR